jgi:hypothetical protein
LDYSGFQDIDLWIVAGICGISEMIQLMPVTIGKPIPEVSEPLEPYINCHSSMVSAHWR